MEDRKAERTQVLLYPEVTRRIREMTTLKGSSMTQIVNDAVRAFIEAPSEAGQADARFAVRLDRHSRAVERLDRRLSFVAEALGTFVQHQLTLVAHQGPFDPETAALGRARYKAFIELVGKRIARAASTGSSEAMSRSEPDQAASDAS
jgi:hypothetical protein